MKLAVAIIAVVASAQAFCPTAFTRGDVASTKTQLFSEPEDDEGGGLDLNLEEMFDMFDAADKGVDFDKALDKVKGGTK